MIEYLLILAIILICAKILGEFSEKIGIPSILGELGTGIILGPALIGLIHDPSEPVFALMAELGIIMLLFVDGFEHVDIKGMLKYKRVSLTLSAVTNIAPLVCVTLWGMSVGFPLETSLMLGIALGATSISIVVRTLIDCNLINSKPGRTLLGSLVINDITCFIMMAIVVGVVSSSSGDLAFDVLKVMGGIGVFFLLFVIAEYVMPYVILYAVRLKVEEAQFSLAFVVVLLAAYFAANLGLSTMIGAFFAGLVLSRSAILETETFAQKISSISYGLFIPLAFVMTGARIEMAHLGETLTLAVYMLALMFALHMTVGFIVGKVFKYRKWDFAVIGLGMVPYGEVSLIVMTALITMARTIPGGVERLGGPLGEAGLMNLFSAVLILIVMTVLITPVLMRLVAKKMRAEGYKPED